jgi:chromosome segregation ATPase
MKNLIGVIILAVVCIGLGVALVTTKKQAKEEKTKDTSSISTLSNQLVETSGKLEDQKQVNLTLEKEINTHKEAYAELTNKYSEVSANLTKTEDTLKLTKDEVTKRDSQIAELEQEKASLDKKAAGLSVSITNLTAQIAETQRKLAASEGDKAFLEKELKRLMGEKAELERQFNDLTVLRAQVSKLKEELNIARRLEWIRKGLFAADEKKGGQLLIQHQPAVTAKPTNLYDLNVEVNADGSVRVIPPLTNKPAATPPTAPANK